MIDPTHRQGTEMLGSDPALSGASVEGAGEEQGAAFRALLDRLAQSARDLNSASSSIEDPRQLRTVVEDARASVEDAVLLGSDLLEAYRASKARSAPDSKT